MSLKVVWNFVALACFCVLIVLIFTIMTFAHINIDCAPLFYLLHAFLFYYSFVHSTAYQSIFLALFTSTSIQFAHSYKRNVYVHKLKFHSNLIQVSNQISIKFHIRLTGTLFSNLFL